MDTAPETGFPNPLTVRGTGSIVVSRDSEVDVLPWLKQRKMKKFMGKQDQMAVIAATMAARDAGLSEDDLRYKTGIYLCVGYIPFERQEIETIARNSSKHGEFSMDLFSTRGFEEVNPLLTFRCLPNMPIFHVSFNLNIQGPYFITYPGPAQFYAALEQACMAFESNEIDFALIGGVADQNNFLVQHHYARSGLARKPTPDAAGFLCLEKGTSKRQLLGFNISYSCIAGDSPAEFWSDSEPHEYYGAASLPVMVDRSRNTGKIQHTLRSIDGIEAQSFWIL